VYRRQGLTEGTARAVVRELTAHNPLGAHLRAEYGVHQDELTTPWHAAFASAVSFTAGFLLPLAAMALCPADYRIPATVLVGLVGLLITGTVSATISGSPKMRPIVRNIVGGAIAMALTWSIGHLFGVGAH